MFCIGNDVCQEFDISVEEHKRIGEGRIDYLFSELSFIAHLQS